MKKHSRNYRLFLILWLAEMNSAIGSGLSAFALGLHVYQSTGSASDIGLISLFSFLPVLLLSPAAGWLADRTDRRKLIMTGDSLSAVGILMILLCMMADQGSCSLWIICFGVFLSSVFSVLIEPAYKATITDLLPKEEYASASGLLSLASGARWLISPALAGLLLSFSDIRLILLIDILTFFPSAAAALMIRRKVTTAGDRLAERKKADFRGDLHESLRLIHSQKGLKELVLISSLITLGMGVFQILAQPVILSFADGSQLGYVESLCAGGMLAAGLLISIHGIRTHQVGILALSLCAAGISMSCFALSRSLPLCCISGFLFFACLPYANSTLDYLVRINIPNAVQGRIWGIIAFISQIGYAAAYALSGSIADQLGRLMRSSAAGGAAVSILAAGLLLIICSAAILKSRPIRNLEETYDLKTAEL